MKKNAVRLIAMAVTCALLCVMLVACDLKANTGDGAYADLSSGAGSIIENSSDKNSVPNADADNDSDESNLPPSGDDGAYSAIQGDKEGGSVDAKPSDNTDLTIEDDKRENGDNSEDEGYIPFVPPVPQYARVGAKYAEVMRPFKEFAQYVVDDLVHNEIIGVPEKAEIDNIRYFYGNSITIEVSVAPYIFETDEDSDFLYARSFINLDDFGCGFEDWCVFRDFLIEERNAEGREDYVSAMLPVATEIAEDLKDKYNEYVSSTQYENVRCGIFDKPIVLKSDSYLHETHDNIIARMNERLSAQNLPLLEDEEILIYLQGSYVDGVAKCNVLNVAVRFQNFNYTFRFDFNGNDEFDTTWLLSFKSESKPGYHSPIDDLSLPVNEAYAELFEALKIEEMDFADCELHTLIDEYTFLYF